jgi:predicted dehydrogenase
MRLRSGFDNDILTSMAGRLIPRLMRVGLIGTGYWARTVHGASTNGHADAQLVGVWGRDAGRTAEAAEELQTTSFSSVEELLGQVDALTFAVPPDVQASIALQAARAGKHVLLEKPVATSAESARALEAAVDAARVASVVFFTRRFVPETIAWLDRLAQIGGWDCGRADFAASIFVEGNPFGNSPWRKEKGGLWDIGPHALSVLLPVLGPVSGVVAGRGRGDQVHMVLEHTNGGSSTISLSLTVPRAAVGTSVFVYGEHGREEAPTSPSEPTKAHAAALTALIAAAESSEPKHPCDVHFGARVVEILAAAEEAQRTGCRVRLG